MSLHEDFEPPIQASQSEPSAEATGESLEVLIRRIVHAGAPESEIAALELPRGGGVVSWRYGTDWYREALLRFGQEMAADGKSALFLGAMRRIAINIRSALLKHPVSLRHYRHSTGQFDFENIPLKDAFAAAGKDARGHDNVYARALRYEGLVRVDTGYGSRLFLCDRSRAAYRALYGTPWTFVGDPVGILVHTPGAERARRQLFDTRDVVGSSGACRNGVLIKIPRLQD